MDLKETGAMVKLIKMTYPNFYAKYTDEDTAEYIQMWHGFLRNEDPVAVRAVLNEHIMSNHYPPSVADIKGKLNKANEPSKNELWEEFHKAVRGAYDYYFAPDGNGSSVRIYRRDKIWETLSEPLKNLVGSARGLEDLHYKYKGKDYELKDMFDRKIPTVLEEYKNDKLHKEIEQIQLEYNADNVKKIEDIARSIGNGNV